MTHAHVPILVEGSQPPGKEFVPAESLGENLWQLLRSPLYAMNVAAGDTIRSTDSESGRFEIVAHGRNVAVQFYMAEAVANDEEATKAAISEITPSIAALGGRLDGYTPGLFVFTIPVAAGFSAIEASLQAAIDEHPGAAWQYANVYDVRSGEPMNWWVG